MLLFHHFIIFTYWDNITTSTFLLSLTDIEYSAYGTETNPAKIYIVYDRVYEAVYSATIPYNSFNPSDLTLTVETTNTYKAYKADYLFTIIHNNRFIPVGGVLEL